MGSHYLTERERREMYLLLILLVSPAFGRPSPDQLDVGEDIGNQLGIFTNFNNETGKLFVNSSVVENVVKMLLEAETHILKMNAELKTLETQEIKFNASYFLQYNEAKSYLRQTRQGLRKLAHRTVADVRDLKILLGALDESKESVFIELFIEKMKDLMIETLKTLKEAKEKYNSAIETFDNLNLSIKSQNKHLEKMVTENSDEYNAWVKKLRGGIYGAITTSTIATIIADVFGCLGICSAVSGAISIGVTTTTELEIDLIIQKYRAEFEKMKVITERMLESGRNFDKAINVAIGILTKEIDLITIWNKSAKTVSKNIDEYSVEFLKEYKSLRTVFINGLDDLKNATENFLLQPKDIFKID